jgi:hypothetical protein
VGLDALGSLALQVTFDVIGVPAILTRPDATVVSTSVIWLEPILIDVPSSTDLQRRESRRVLAVSRSDVVHMPRGSRIDAAERDDAVVQAWRVDQLDASDPDHLRAIVVPW